MMVEGTATPVPEGGPLLRVEALEGGTEVREYRIDKRLGEGGMGVVYKAEHTLTGQKVAIKVVWPELMRNESVRRRFLEEARVLGQLEHPNIVSLLNFFEEQGVFFLVMSFIDGETLDDLLERRPLNLQEAVDLMSALLSALEYAHSGTQSVVHRDIKPANIMLKQDGAPVLTDFGVAKAFGREKMTRTNAAVGTYEYMSPEQVQGEEVSPASDIYSCGITLYRMLAGVVPFPQKSEGGFECQKAHVEAPVPRLTEYSEGVPAQLQAVLDRALSKDPRERYGTAREMKEGLKRACEHRPAEPLPPLSPSLPPTPPSPPPPRPSGDHDPRSSGRSTAYKVLIASCLVVSVAVLAFVMLYTDLLGGKKEEARKPPDSQRQGQMPLANNWVAPRAAGRVKIPDEPDLVVREAVAALKQGDLHKIHAMLPESYQKDVQKLVDGVTSRMDKEIYDKTLSLLPKIIELAKQKRTEFPVPPEVLELAGEFTRLLKTADLVEYEGFAELDVADFLEDHGKAFSDFGWKLARTVDRTESDSARKMLDSVRAEVVGEPTDDAATVSVTVDDDQDDMEFVRVEGKWIPRELAEEWKEDIESANGNIAEAMAGLQKNRGTINAQLQGLEDAVARGDVSMLQGLLGVMGGSL